MTKMLLIGVFTVFVIAVAVLSQPGKSFSSTDFTSWYSNYMACNSSLMCIPTTFADISVPVGNKIVVGTPTPAPILIAFQQGSTSSENTGSIYNSFYQSSEGSDQKIWAYGVLSASQSPSGNPIFFIQTINDAYNMGYNALEIGRTNGVPAYVAIPNSPLFVGSNTDDTTGAMVQVTGNVNVAGGSQYMVAGSPIGSQATGSNPGTQVCIDANNNLCPCGSCA